MRAYVRYIGYCGAIIMASYATGRPHLNDIIIYCLINIFFYFMLYKYHMTVQNLCVSHIFLQRQDTTRCGKPDFFQ